MEYCDHRVRLFVCLSVGLSTRISQQSYYRTSPNFVFLLLMAVAQSVPGGVKMRYTLPVFYG